MVGFFLFFLFVADLSKSVFFLRFCTTIRYKSSTGLEAPHFEFTYMFLKFNPFKLSTLARIALIQYYAFVAFF